MPPRAVTISFDDGFIECFTVARPLLLARGIPATFFVCNNFIDNRDLMFRNKVALCISRLACASSSDLAQLIKAVRLQFGIRSDSYEDVRKWLYELDFSCRELIDRMCECLGIDVPAFLRDRRPYMARSQIAQLHKEGFTIGAHTVDHPQLGQLSDWNEVQRQIGESCRIVREMTGRTSVPFAFPFNGLGLPRPALAALRDDIGGIDLMYDTNGLMNDCSFIVNRICCDTPAKINCKYSNIPMLLLRARTLEPIRALRRWLCGLPSWHSRVSEDINTDVIASRS